EPIFVAMDSLPSQNTESDSNPAEHTRTASTNELKTEVYSPRTRAKRMATWMGVGAVVLAAAGFTVAARWNAPTAKASVPTGTDISLSLSAYPSSATIKIDDREVGNAFDARVPRDDVPHHVYISAKGYAPQQVTISFATDLRREFRLEAEPQVHAAST